MFVSGLHIISLIISVQVKFGNTVMHFNVRVDVNNQMNLDMVGLRAKIRSYFNFNADANFSLRYVDEEGDLVNLMDDDDLHDIMRLQLEFLRIEVHDNGLSLRKKIIRYAWNITYLYFCSRAVVEMCSAIMFSKSNV